MVNLTRYIEQKKQDSKEYTLLNLIYVKFKNRPNESMVLEIRLMVTCGEDQVVMARVGLRGGSGAWRCPSSPSGCCHTGELTLKSH